MGRDNAAAAGTVDLIRPGARGIGPVGKSAPTDSAEDGTELRPADQEGSVRCADLAIHVGEVHMGAVRGRDHRELFNPPRAGSPSTFARGFADFRASFDQTLV